MRIAYLFPAECSCHLAKHARCTGREMHLQGVRRGLELVGPSRQIQQAGASSVETEAPFMIALILTACRVRSFSSCLWIGRLVLLLMLYCDYGRCGPAFCTYRLPCSRADVALWCIRLPAVPFTLHFRTKLCAILYTLRTLCEAGNLDNTFKKTA